MKMTVIIRAAVTVKEVLELI